MHILLSYDIANNRQRTRMSNELLNYGLQRVQKSVFEGEIKTAEFEKLKTGLKKYITKHDSIRYYVLCKECQSKTQALGRDHMQKEHKQTMIL